jgi:Glycosyl hydrolase family 26
VRPSLAILAALTALAVAPIEASAAPHRPVVFGANTTGITEDTGEALDRLAAEVGRMPRIAMYYRDWDQGYLHPLISRRFLDPIRARRAVPMITWLPRLGSGDPVQQPDYAPAAIAAGAFDPFIRQAAREAAAYGHVFFLRLAHEMNGAWSPWGAGVDGNSAADYVAMWRHVVSIFREDGAANVRWVWAPNVYREGAVPSAVTAAPFQPFYPGDKWVDYVALDGYNRGGLSGGGWRSFAEVFKSSYDAMTALTRKPLMITETASTEVGGDKAAWIGAIPAALRLQMPRVRALIWFDRGDKGADWEIDSSPASVAAFRRLAGNPVLGGGTRALLGGGRHRRPGRGHRG